MMNKSGQGSIADTLTDICEINFNKDINEHYNPGHHKG